MFKNITVDVDATTFQRSRSFSRTSRPASQPIQDSSCLACAMSSQDGFLGSGLSHRQQRRAR